jgi:iron complex transport system ATP-binding protein
VPPVPVLQLHEATVVKDDRAVLDRLSLTIHEREHTAIVGPNGAGKSVLVGLLTHYERPLARSSGVPPVRVFGADNWNVFDLRSQLGIVSADLHNRFVTGNSEGRITATAAVLSAFLVSHGILRYGAVTDDMRRRTAAALEAVGAAHLGARTLDQMSSGEARRVMLARALVTAPRALVLDEPTTGLDLVARHGFMERVRAIARAGTTLILITHHIEEIVPEIGRLVLLRGGRVAADGPRAETLTASRLSEVFGAPVALEEAGGYVYAKPATGPSTAFRQESHP